MRIRNRTSNGRHHGEFGLPLPWILFASALLIGCANHQASRDRPRNVVLISIDTLRADHLGCYGYSRDVSPTIDQLAADGLLFEDVTAPSPWTLPAHASLLTGRYPSRHGLKSHYQYLPNHFDTIAELLQSHEFDTAAVVNSHYLSDRYGLDRGFDHFIYVEEHAGQATPSRVEDEAKKWLSTPKERPFLLFLHYYDVHSDYSSLPEYEQMFVGTYQGLADGTTKQLIDFRRGRVELNRSDIQHLIDLYDAGIRQMDDGIERLLQFLKQRKLLENTLIVITSDHGEEFLEHGNVLHGRTHFQEVLRVPLIMCGPGIVPGKRVRHIVSLLDVMPTILELADVPVPDSLDGTDLSYMWQEQDAVRPARFLYSEADHENVLNDLVVNDIKRAVRDTQYKLHYDTVTRDFELYDLETDPGETNDLFAQNGETAELLIEQLDQFMLMNTTTQPAEPLSAEEVEKLKSLGYLK